MKKYILILTLVLVVLPQSSQGSLLRLLAAITPGVSMGVIAANGETIGTRLGMRQPDGRPWAKDDNILKEMGWKFLELYQGPRWTLPRRYSGVRPEDNGPEDYEDE